MKITRRFTQADKDVYADIEWTRRTSRITNLDGSVVFEMKDAQVPASWSQLATDIMVSKYFRKAGVAQHDEHGELITDDQGKVVTGPERSARQVIHRLAECWRDWGHKHGYFDSDEDASAFYDELAYMMLNQMAAPNSPQWFNTGLFSSYGINGPAQGHYYTDPATGQTVASTDAYSHPQPHACFIQSIDDDLVSPGGIMDLWVREARLFKYGSGTGTNFSKLRGEDEPLSGGGKSSGLMSFLKIGDRAAGAIKSGGTTRRAAKMVCLDLDHPDIENFIAWKVREELKVAAMVEGIKHLPEQQKQAAQKLGLQLDYDFNGEAYQTASGQNSNNSIRISNDFFRALDEDDQWELRQRTDGKVAKTLRARQLWDLIGDAAWHCADPGVQYDTTINQWHTCPESGRINASNPCSEYMFLDNTACNLASLNLLKFYDAKTRRFDIEAYEHAITLWTIVLEISVLMAQYPSEEIARLSHEYRTLGLGFANLGAMLMQGGIAYDSDQARALCGCLSSILTAQAYATSAAMAAEHGPFSGYFKNREHMLRVICNHRRAAYGVPRDRELADQHELGGYEGLEVVPVPIDAQAVDGHEQHQGHLANGKEILHHARRVWDDALALGQQHGYRNAQVSVIAPTGTIGLLMDCDTTGVEPDFALVKFKKLAGGGYFKIANQSLRPALENLGYDQQQVDEIISYVLGKLTLDVPMPITGGGGGTSGQVNFAHFLREAGLDDDDLAKVTEALPTVFELPQAFGSWIIGPQTIERLGLADKAQLPGFDLLSELGLSTQQREKLNHMICGTQTVEGTQALKAEHLSVFDCANTCGKLGTRLIRPEGHIRMMGAAQPFISGAISKTINLHNSATVGAIKAAYRLSWELGLKANALYRDGCKLSQVLNNKVDSDEQIEAEADDPENVDAGRDEVARQVVDAADAVARQAPVEKIVERIVERPLRRRLPDTRRSLTHKFNVAGHEGYLTVGLYDNGEPGELFITMAKEGSTIGGLMDSLGTAISVALQYGVPVESLVNKFTHQRFEPAGMTHNRDIPFAKSLVDYIFRWMGMEFIPGYRAANAPQRDIPDPSAAASENQPPESDAAIVPTQTDTANQAQAKAQSIAHPNPTEADGGNGHGNGKTNGNGNGGSSWVVEGDRRLNTDPVASSTLTAAMNQMQSDAPACDVCGAITVRNGTCYKCLNCGASMGCS